MSSQISHEWLIDGLPVDKQDLRDEIDQIAAEMSHGGFFARIGDSGPNTQTAERLLDHFVSVRADFGAPRNFTPTTQGADAAPAINNAISAVVSAWGGGTVYVPPGVFWVGSPVIMKSNVRLIGAGLNTTRIKLMNNAATHVITHESETDTHIVIQDMTVDGNRSSSGNRRTWYDGINMRSILDSFNCIRNVFITACTRDGLHLNGGRMASTFHNILASKCDRHGIYVSTYDNIFTLCQTASTGTDGIRVNGGPNKFVGGKAYFGGNGTARFTAWPNNFFGESMLGSTSDGFDNTAPSKENWRTGAGIHNSGSINEFASVEIQDTWGPGFVETAAYETRFNGVIGNVGDLAPSGPRHTSAGWPDTNDRYVGVRAAVQLAAAYDSYFDFTTRAQSVRFQSGSTMCDYIARTTNSAAKNVKFRVIAATTNNSGGAATHVSNLSILETAPKDPTVELLVNAL